MKMTRQELINKEYVSVGYVGEYEWMVKKTEDNEYLYHVLKDGAAIYQYPKSLDEDTIEGVALIKRRFLYNNNFN